MFANDTLTVIKSNTIKKKQGADYVQTLINVVLNFIKR